MSPRPDGAPYAGGGGTLRSLGLGYSGIPVRAKLVFALPFTGARRRANTRFAPTLPHPTRRVLSAVQRSEDPDPVAAKSDEWCVRRECSAFHASRVTRHASRPNPGVATLRTRRVGASTTSLSKGETHAVRPY